VLLFLTEDGQQWENQYLLTIDVPNAKGELEPVRVQSERSGLSLVSASRIDCGH